MCEVLVTGTFNVIHAGHIELLDFASKLGKVTVGINTDAYLKVKYGDLAVPLRNRTKVLNSLKQVQEIVSFAEEHPGELIRKLRPAYYIKGPDYENQVLPEQSAIDSECVKVLIYKKPKLYSGGELTKTLSEKDFEEIDLLDIF